MTFDEMLAEIYTLTDRSDLVAESTAALKSATLKAHQLDYFYKDLVETAIQFSTADYLQQLEYKTVFPLWRALKYLRKYDAVDATPGDFIELITTDEVLDSYSVQREDVCYVAGLQLQIRSCTEERYFLIGYYKNPTLVVADYSSWIAADHPYALIYSAASVVFKTIGYDEQASLYRDMTADEYTLLRQNNILANGY